MSIALRPERREHVGASECASLWSLGWETRYKLHARKAGLLPHDGGDAEQLQIGRILEPAVAEVVKEQTGWALHKVRRYSPHPNVAGMGASLDYEIVSHPDGPGVCEIKTTDAGTFARWGGEVPIQYELQLQHQLACTGRDWGVLAVLVSNRKLELYQRKRAPDAILRIELEIPIFWDEVKAGLLPAPDYRVDSETLVEIFRSTTAEKVVDLSLDEEAQRWAVSYKAAARAQAAAEKEKKEAKAALLARMGDAEVALLPHGKVSSKAVPEMEIPATTRRAYRSWSVTVEDMEAEL